jgi:hypothetical protein
MPLAALSTEKPFLVSAWESALRISDWSSTTNIGARAISKNSD